MIEDNFLPEGFRAMTERLLGREKGGILLTALEGEPETSVRLNRYKTPSFALYEGMSGVDWCASARYLCERPNFTMNPLLHAGAFYVQDASSTVYETIVSQLTDGRAMRAADLCAAPGGKTTAMLNALPEGSVMLANEYVGSRATILKENLCKYGYPGVVITNSDLRRLAKMRGYFDIVSIDAPCSGEGMMRKERAAREQWTEGLTRQCSTLQREIIDNGIEMLAPGGILIYSTCTFNSIENEENAAYIANKHGLTPIDTGLAGKYGIQGELTGNVACLRFMPGFTRGEGLFVAVFRKNGYCTSPSKGKKSRKGNEKSMKTAGRLLTLAKSWIKGEGELRQHGDYLLALTPATAELLDHIPDKTRILSAGITVGEIKGKDLIPAHQLAMATNMAHPFAEVEIAEPEALKYLRKDAITLPDDTPRGYVTLTYRGFPLGFVKNLGTRCNNLYPAEYKIRTKG